MFNRMLEINKKDAGAINHVIGFCGIDEELILLEEDLECWVQSHLLHHRVPQSPVSESVVRD